MAVEDIETVNHHCGDLLECGGGRAAKNEARNSIQRFDVKSTAEKPIFLALPSSSRRATLFAHLIRRPASPSSPTTSNNLLFGLSTLRTSLLRPTGRCRQWENGFKLEFPCWWLRNARPSRGYNGKGSRGGHSAFTWYYDPRSPFCRSY